MKKSIWILVMVVSMLNLAVYGYCDDPARKLVRGIANIVLCPVEIPQTMIKYYNESFSYYDSVIIGVPKGIGMTIVRAGAGLYETLTFPFPIPENYKPVIEPEFVWER